MYVCTYVCMNQFPEAVENVLHTTLDQCSIILLNTTLIASSLPYVVRQATCGAGRSPVRASSMVLSTFRCRQTKPEINILFATFRILNYCGRSIWICRDQLRKSGTKIRYQNFNGIAWVFLILWVFGRYLAHTLHRPLKLKCIWRILNLCHSLLI